MNKEQYFSSDAAALLLVSKALEFSQRDVRTVCEPCAGDGALVRALLAQRPQAAVHAYDIDPELCKAHSWMQGDFLSAAIVPCDLVLCNPPFSSGRADGANGRRGKDLALAFLLRACEWAPLVAFVMHQNKGNPTFAHQLWKVRPDVSLIHHECMDKKASVFRVAGSSKFVPCAIYIYRTGQSGVREPVLYKSMECADLEFVDRIDPRCNLVVKSWGSMNRVGRAIEKPAAEVTTAGKHGVNMHFVARDPARSRAVIERMHPALMAFLAYARDCSNVKITPAQFVHFYNESRQ